jgi:hypothetical protein
MFPISIEGTVDVPHDGANAALDRLRIAVSTKGASSIERQPNRLLFRGKALWGASWNPLVFFDRCEVSVGPQKIEYNCSMKIAFIWITGMVGAIWLLILSSEPKLPLAPLIVLPLLSWLWLFCGNYFVGRAKMRGFLATAVRA